MVIRAGRREDAIFLSKVVTEALGPDLSKGLAGGEDRLPLVDKLFATLAAEPRSQYSYNNALIATTNAGIEIGGIIVYDGESLHSLRKAFAREANKILGWDVSEEEVENWDDEAQPREIYIDSLYVVPEYRKRGVASALIKEVEKKFAKTHKPLGLLVEPVNKTALQMYLNLGFKRVGISNFFQTPMLHLQKDILSPSQ